MVCAYIDVRATSGTEKEFQDGAQQRRTDGEAMAEHHRSSQVLMSQMNGLRNNLLNPADVLHSRTGTRPLLKHVMVNAQPVVVLQLTMTAILSNMHEKSNHGILRSWRIAP